MGHAGGGGGGDGDGGVGGGGVGGGDGGGDGGGEGGGEGGGGVGGGGDGGNGLAMTGAKLMQTSGQEPYVCPPPTQMKLGSEQQFGEKLTAPLLSLALVLVDVQVFVGQVHGGGDGGGGVGGGGEGGGGDGDGGVGGGGEGGGIGMRMLKPEMRKLRPAGSTADGE